MNSAMLVLVLSLTSPSKHGEESAGQPADFLPKVKRILFLGDSITYDGKYISIIETEILLQGKDRRLGIISCGLPSETVSGLSEEGHAGGKFPRPDLHERLQRVLNKAKPDLVFACYGMNDGIYLPFSDARFKKYQDGRKRLHEQVESVGARIIHLTPPVFDPLPIRQRVAPADQVNANRPFEGYDDVLERYSHWLVEMRAKGWQVIDLHGPMKAELARRRRADAKFTFCPDGVHPNQAGHIFLGQVVLQGLKPPFTPGTKEFGDINDPSSRRAKVFQLVHQKRRILTDAWLTDTGHKRPMPAGWPMDKARAKAADIDQQIQALLR